MIHNVITRDELRGEARSRARDYETRTVHPKVADDMIADGWTVERHNQRSVRLRRPKASFRLLEDRVWMLMYRTGFLALSGEGGAKLAVNSKDPNGPVTQIDVVGIDDELALAVECKSSERYDKRPQFGKEMAKHALIRERFAQASNKQFPAPAKRQVVLAMFLQNAILSENDKARAREENVLLFDENDLIYYEQLTNHLGPAAKYQLFAEMLPGKTVPGLTLRVPAIRTKMGGTYCYAFSIAPSYLLKIAFISHRSKGKASDVHTYQRMLSKSRLSKIRDYISDDGVFPTNIVISFDSKLRFDRVGQDDQENGLLGWLEIRPAYKSAWIIDGQHRLFAYSGHERATKSRVAVIAFENLPPSRQAAMFIDINARQKSVKQSLLQELYAELNWDADEPAKRVSAVISKTVQVLDATAHSPLFHRVQTADGLKSDTKCISLTSVYGALERSEFFIAKQKQGHVIEYGPLWAGSNDRTLSRAVYVISEWLSIVSSRAEDWWSKGAGEGGGLAMNDGVTTCISVLRSVFDHLSDNKAKLLQLDEDDLVTITKPYGVTLGDYFGSLNDEGRRRFRDLRGNQGLAKRLRLCQQALRAQFPNFNPPGLDQFIAEEKAQTNVRAKELVDRIERTLQRVVIEELKRECGSGESEWWTLGVPKPVRLRVGARYEEEDGKRGGKEYYFDLIDYRNVAVSNWQLFEPLLGYGSSGGKDKRTLWMAFVNEQRKVVSHPSSAVTVSMDDLSQLEKYAEWLSGQTSGTGSVMVVQGSSVVLPSET